MSTANSYYIVTHDGSKKTPASRAFEMLAATAGVNATPDRDNASTWLSYETMRDEITLAVSLNMGTSLSLMDSGD